MHCEQCRRPLKHAREICQACSQELPYPTSSNSNKALGAGRYRCPACNGFFDRWTTTLLPREARWYTYQDDVPTCPLCDEVLQWRRDMEPAQLPAGLQGIAIGMLWGVVYAIPAPVNRWIMEYLGQWLLPLFALLPVAMFFIAVRPSLQGTGRGTGHFALAQPRPFRKPQFWASLIFGIAIMASVWTAPKAAQLPLWCVWLGLAAAGCLAAVLWRRSGERHQRLHTPDPAAQSPTRLS